MEDAHTIRRNRLLWAAPVLVALAAVACMPVNVYVADDFNYDPQGEDQIRSDFVTTAVLRHTSGFVVGSAMAVLVGAVLFVRRRRRDPDRTEPAAVAATVAWAALSGVILAAVNVGVAWLLGGPKLIVGGWLGDPVVVDVVYDEGILAVIFGWAAMFPALAVVGVGLGALTRRVGRVSRALNAPGGRPPSAHVAMHPLFIVLLALIPATVVGVYGFLAGHNAVFVGVASLITLAAAFAIFVRYLGPH